MWAPLYPALLALFELVGLDALVAARWVNAGFHASVAGIAGLSLRRITGEPAIPVLVALGLVLSPVQLDQAIVVMSEPLFAFLVLCCLLVLARHLHHPHPRTLLAAAVLAMLAWLTRYAGFALVATACLLLVARRGRSFRASVGEAVVFGAVALAPMLAWLLRNYLVSATATGVRHPSPYSFAYFAELALQRVGQWFLPPRAGAITAVVLGALVIAVATAVLVPAVISGLRDIDERSPWWDAPAQSATVVFAAFTLVYIASIISLISLSFATNDPNRLLAPAVPSTLMLAGLLLARVRPARWRLASVAVGTALLLVWPARYAIGLIQYTRRNGAGGVASDRWQRSGMIAYLRQHGASLRRSRAPVYSNEPTAVYLLTNLESVFWLPPHDHPYSPVPARQALGAFARQLPQREPTYVVLFDEALEEFTYSRSLLEATVPVRAVRSQDDGVLYRVEFSRMNAPHIAQ